MERTSRRLCPVMVAISASVHPASARRVTAVPRKSLKVIPTMPALADAFRQLARNPSDVQGLPSAVVSMKVLCLWGSIQCDLERRTDRNNDPSAGLRLLKPDVLSVIGRPRQAQ